MFILKDQRFCNLIKCSDGSELPFLRRRSFVENLFHIHGC
uniref:Uncharacterized protein n=1 Tax=Solanum lycopersicum TaxID=4081 RepID=A0A3Q7EQH6_SOLLC